MLEFNYQFTRQSTCRSRSGFTLIELAALVAVVALLIIVLLPPGCGSFSKTTRRAQCQLNLKRLGWAIHQYAQDFDGRLPIVRVNDHGFTNPPSSSYAVSGKLQDPYLTARPFGWADALYPYLDSMQIYYCPNVTTPHSTNPDAPEYTDYWFNRRLNGIKVEVLTAPALTIISGDGNSNGRGNDFDVSNTRYSKSSLPRSWLTDPAKPATRHLGMANYLFVDGHVKALQPSGVATQSSGDKAAFFIK